MKKASRDSLSEKCRYFLLNQLALCLPPSASADKSVVVYTPGHLGDILHVVPMLKALRVGKPEAKIIWLVGPWSETLAHRYHKQVDEIRIFGPQFPQFTRGKREWKQPAWTQWRLALALRREGVATFIGAADAASRFLVNVTTPELWVGMGEWRPPRVRSSVKTQFQPYEKDRFEADAWTGVLHGVGIGATADSLAYTVVADEAQKAMQFLQAEGVDLARPLAVIAPGSGWSGKNWLPERFAAVATWLTKEKGFQVAWIGGGDERLLVPKLDTDQFDWTGKTDLSLVAAVMAQAGLFVGNDGGLLHFASALNVPTVSVWGPTDPAKWGPKGLLHRQIREMERCEGCIYWDYRESCHQNQRCMKAVSIEAVKSAVDSVLGS